VRSRVCIAIGGILLLLGAAATAPATPTTRSPTRVTIKAPRLAEPGEIVRVDGTALSPGSSSIYVTAPGLFRVFDEAGSMIRRKILRIHEGRFRTWTRFSKPGVYRVSVFYPGSKQLDRLPGRASVKIRVT
jgi:hypothetical protein